MLGIIWKPKGKGHIGSKTRRKPRFRFNEWHDDLGVKPRCTSDIILGHNLRLAIECLT